MQKVGIGQDSHRFLKEEGAKPCLIGGLHFEEMPGMDADSDGDVIFHAICNAISSITHVPILGDVAISLCKLGIKDSKVYLEEALKTLGKYRIGHVALAIEGKRPKFQSRSNDLRKSVAKAMQLDVDAIGITFTSGDELTSFAKGEGLQCLAIVTVNQDVRVR